MDSNQIRMDDEGNIINSDESEKKILVYNEDGSLSELEDDRLIELIKPKHFNAKNFANNYMDYTGEVLQQLLALQSNDAPLKSGGTSIAYRFGGLVQKNRQYFSARENTILDVLMAQISTYPENKSYEIYPAKLNIYEGSDSSYKYSLFKSPLEEAKKKQFIFNVIDDKGRQMPLTINWHELCIYNDTKDENAVIHFVPSPFFKMITLAATIARGAYYNIEVASRIGAPHVRQLYYYLEMNKKRRQYKGAKEGYWIESLTELRDQLGYPESYSPNKIKTRILDPGMELINSFTDLDFTFTAKLTTTNKTYKTGRKGFDAVIFETKVVSNIDVKNSKELPAPAELSENEKAMKVMLNAYRFTEKEAQNLTLKCREYKRDIVFLTTALTKLSNAKGNYRFNYLNKIIENGLMTPTPKKNAFNEIIEDKEHKEQYAEIFRKDEAGELFD